MNTRSISILAVACVLAGAAPIYAQRVLENLGRGVIALHSSDTEVYVGWRMLATDPADVAFNLYRSTGGSTPVKLNTAPLATTTDFVDTTADLSQPSSYFVRPVFGGVEQAASAAYTLLANAPAQQYIQIPIQQPPGGTATCVTSTSSYTYNANDGSIGDLDGDGQYEIVLKWDPSNSQDNSNDGCTGPQILDAYKLDGTRLWRINLGPNIRSGAHYTQFMVYDLDGDGKAEVVMKTADGTVDGLGNTIGDPTKLWVNAQGRILAGPEYLTVFDGKTGAALATTDYLPPRGSVAAWGDSYGNRVDRFLAAVAYLDGERPSVVMARGYYTRTTLAAWDWRDGKLTLRWFFDSRDPAHPEYLAYENQGNHNLSVADVDVDGMDEIIYGSAVINHDGTGRFSTGFRHGDAMHVSRFDPSNPDLLVYGVHELSSINPTTCLASPNPVYGTTLYNARTGELTMFTDKCVKRDAGRGLAAALDPNNPGAQFWGGAQPGGLVNLAGVRVASAPKSTNFAVWWDADLLRELEDGTSITKYDIGTGATSTLLSCADCASNNGTKATPVLTGDLFGDWREEAVWRTADNQFLRIYTTTVPAVNRLYTLLQDPQYRLALVWQNVAYNQPPWPSFYVGPFMQEPPRPDILYPVTLSASIVSKSGPPPRRVWTIGVTNTGTAAAPGAMIQGFSLIHTSGSGPNCAPVVTDPAQFPIELGTIAPGATAMVDITLNVTNCSSNARLAVTAPISAMDGAATTMLQRTNEPR